MIKPEEVISVSIIEDKHELRKSLRILINESTGFKCVSSYESCEVALKKIFNDRPDVVLMDIEFGENMSGIDGVKLIKEKLPATNIIMLTIYEDNEFIFHSLKNGASGYLIKNASLGVILNGIKEVYQGGAPMSMHIARKVVDSFKRQSISSELSKREIEILEKLCQCKSYQAIANELFIEKTTVKFHIKNIYKKLHVVNKAEAIIKAKDNNIF